MIKNVITINDFNYSQGGASKVAIDTANMLAECGINSIFISAVSDDSKSTLSNKIIQYRFNGIEFLKYKNKIKGMLDGLRFRKFTKFVENVIEKYNPEETIIHVHGWTKACSSDFFTILKKNKYKTFLTLHEYFSFCCTGAYFNYKKNVACNKKGCSIDCLLSNCDSRNYIFKIYRYIRELQYRRDIDFNYINTIFISKFEKHIVEKQFNVHNSFIIENPIMPLKKSNNQKDYDFIYVGRTSKEKGIDIFIKMAERLTDKKFLIVGNYESKLNNVFVTGWVSEKEVDNYLNRSRILVFPSLWPETFGLNVVRALNAGIPCLVSSNTAAEDYVIEGENGFIFEQGDLIDLINKASLTYNLTPFGKTLDDNYIQKIIGAFNEN